MCRLSKIIIVNLRVMGLLVGLLASGRDVQATSPRQIVEVVDIANVVMSPDGRSVAFRVHQAAIERNALDTVWYVQDVYGTAEPRRVADGGFAMQEFWGLPAPAPAVWSPDGRWIYYGAMINGKIDIWRAAADGSHAEPVTLDPADVRKFALSADGRILKYSVAATREEVIAAEEVEHDYGIRIDKSVPIGQPLFRSGYLAGRLATQRYRGGMELYRTSLLADVAERWNAIDLATGQRRPVEPSGVPPSSDVVPAQPMHQTEPPGHVLDPKTGRVALLTNSGKGEGLYRQPFAELAVVPGPEKQPIECQLEQCRNKAITNVNWRPSTDEVIFTVTDPDEGLAQSIFRWDFENDVVGPVVRSGGLVNGGRDESSSCGISAQVLVCVASEADRPPRLERIDLQTGQRDVLFEPNAALASNIAATTPARLLRWKDANGQTITGQFFAARRRDGHLPPLFVNLYRCSGFIRGGTGDEWPMTSLAESGISSLCLNHAPSKLDAVERYDTGLEMVRSAIALLASAGEIDRTKVGMGGLSFGTEVTLWTAVNSNLLTAASVSSVGLTPLGHALRNLHDDSFLPVLRKYWQLGSPDETPERWQRLSMAFNVEAIQAPIMMQLPEHEYIRSMDYAVPLIKGRKADLYVFPEEAHFKFQPRHKLAVYDRNLDWFKFWLLDEENSEPFKQEQYARWRKMKAKPNHNDDLPN